MENYLLFMSLWGKEKLVSLKSKSGKIKDNINLFLKMFYFYLSFVGIFGFSLFIAEESIQTIVFGSFAAQTAHRYDLLKTNIEAIEGITKTSRTINTWCMWINPFQYWSYGAFLDGSELYVTSVKALILANAPELYINEKISMAFKPDSYSAAQNNLFIAENRSIKVILRQAPASKTIQVTGMAQADPDKKDGIVIINQEN